MKNVMLNTSKEERDTFILGSSQVLFRKKFPKEPLQGRYWLSHEGMVYGYFDPLDMHSMAANALLRYLKDRQRVLGNKLAWNGFKVSINLQTLANYYKGDECMAKMLYFKSLEVIKEPFKIDLVGLSFYPRTFMLINDPFEMKDLRERLLA